MNVNFDYIRGRIFLKYAMFFGLFLVLLAIFVIFSTQEAEAKTVVDITDSGTQWFNENSAQKAVLDLKIYDDAQVSTVNWINVTIYDVSGFDSSNLSALAAGPTSGMAIYSESGGSVGFDGADNEAINVAPTWMNNGTHWWVNITIHSTYNSIPGALPANPNYYVVLRTSASVNSNTRFRVNLTADAINGTWGNTTTTGNTGVIRTDIADPSITYLSPGTGGDTTWYNADPGNIIDINFVWGGAGNSPLVNGSYRIGSGSWVDVFNTPRTSNYVNLWGITWSNLAEGANLISLRVYDEAGNSLTHTYVVSTSGFRFMKDTYQPNIQYNQPGAGGFTNWYNSNPANIINIDFIKGGVDNSSLVSASYRIGATWYSIFSSSQPGDYTTNWQINWGALPDGNNSIAIRVIDDAGNTRLHNFVAGTSGFRFRKDNTKPTITYNYPTAGGNTTWYFSDPGNVIDIDFGWVADSPLDNASYKINGGGWLDIFSSNQASDYSTDWGIPWGSLAEGVNNISVSVWDVAGNFKTHNFVITQFGFQFFKDTSVPKITYNYPTRGNDTLWYNSDVGNVIDIDFSKIGNSPLVNASYRIGNGAWEYIFNSEQTSFTSNWGLTWVNLSEGPNQISIRVFNKAGASITDTFASTLLGFRFLMDTTDPTITYNNPSAGGDTPWYSGTSQGNFVNIDFGWLADAPLINASYRIGSGNWISIFGTERSSDYTQNWGLSWGSVPQGITQISIRVYDKAGNSIVHTYSAGISGFRVRKDTTPPGILYNNPTNGDNTSWYSTDPGTIFDIDFTWIANAPLINASFRIGTGQWEFIFSAEMSADYTTNWALDWSALAEGENEIHLRAYDKAGNMVDHTYTMNSKGFIFKRDTTPPNPISFNINSGMKYTNLTTVTLTISASDLHSGIYQMRISNDGVFDTEPWEAYSSTKPWSITTGDGNKTIYIMFRDIAMVQSSVLSSYILLDTAPPNTVTWSMTPTDVNEDSTGILNITVELDDVLGSGVFKAEINYTLNGVTSGFLNMENYNGSYWRILIDPAKIGTGSGYTWDELQGNTLRYTVRVTDRAGNIGITTERSEYIDPVNDPPVITNDDVNIATEEEFYNISYFAIDIDPTGDTLTWSLDSNATWLTIDTNTGVLSGIPAVGDAGVYYVIVTVSDGKGGFDEHHFDLTVKRLPNANPKITTNNVLTIEAKTLYSVDYDATDDRTLVVDLVWSMQTNATWLSFDPSTGILSGTPQSTHVGHSYWVKITVGDGEGGFASTNFTLKVIKPANSKPELSQGKLEPKTGDTDTDFTFSVVYTDADNDPGEVWVWLDGEKNQMDPDSNDNDYTDGVVYTLDTKLDEGIHTYYFTGTDGTNDAIPGDASTPIDSATALNTDDIDNAKPDDGGDQTIMYAGIVIVIIIIIILLLFMFMRGRGKGYSEAAEVEGEPGKPKIVGPVDEDSEDFTAGEDVGEDEDDDNDEYPYEGVSEPGGYEDLETGELSEDVMDMDMDLEGEVQVSRPLKPAVETLELEDRMEIMELGLVMPCSICQGIMPAGEKVFQCTCGLVSHKDCVSGISVCPQCGKEITIPELKKEPTTKKLPLITKEVKRELEEQKPPTKAFFSFIPNKTSEKELADYIGGYFKSHEFGTSQTDDELRFVRLFIKPECAKIMLDHCYEHGRKKEVMGLMIGQSFHYKNDVFSIVKNVVTSELDATEVNVKFDSFEKLFDELDQIDYEYQIIGWYHSHPSYTSFMSPTDVDTQARMFKHPYQYAIVIDPIKNDMNAFTLDQVKKNKVKEKPFAIIDYEE